MAPMDAKAYQDKGHGHKELEYLIRKCGGQKICRKTSAKSYTRKSEVLGRAEEVKLDQAAVDAFFAQTEVQDDIRDKTWCTAEVIARLTAAASNIAPTSNTAQNPFHSTSSSANAFSAISEDLKAEIIAKSRECLGAETKEEYCTLNDLIGEREVLYERAQRIHPSEFETFKLERHGPQDIFDERRCEER